MQIEANKENLPQVLEFVEGCLEEADCPMKSMMQISIAVEEVFVNIASYAYSPEIGDVVINVETDPDSALIRITLEDRGVPYDPLIREDPDVTLSAEERQIGGLGVYMVKQSMDNVTYEFKDGKNILTLEKKFR
jgi:anti-sigma regulatory factor (Ser/Thr protein kinase)